MKYDQSASDTPEENCMPVQPAARISTEPMPNIAAYGAMLEKQDEAHVKQPDFQKPLK